MGIDSSGHAPTVMAGGRTCRTEPTTCRSSRGAMILWRFPNVKPIDAYVRYPEYNGRIVLRATEARNVPPAGFRGQGKPNQREAVAISQSEPVRISAYSL